MIACPNCGTSNPDGSRFCENCGADLRSLSGSSSQSSGQIYTSPPTTPPPSFFPPPVDTGGYRPSDLPPTSPDWRMSSLPAEPPPPKKRRTWLWILLGLIGAIVICCCAFTIWASTAGEDRVNGWLTRVSDFQTEAAATSEAD